MIQEKQIRALGLCSGGLDSILSALILRDQGIYVEWISFETPFFSSEKANKAAQKAKIPLTIKNITSEYIKMLKNPRAGYGKFMNPCMDCHALMFKLAGQAMKEMGFDFLFSGEVLGQRPMSQTKPSLRYVEKHSGFEGLIVRPLSAKKLGKTIPEKQGWINREMLLEISGRSRKNQISLAEKYNITGFPAPAGGCLLTDKNFSIRLKDLFDHQDFYSEDDLHLLKYGRHIRLNKEAKLIVGRNEKDNENIIKHYYPEKGILINLKDIPGPVALLPCLTYMDKDIILIASSICAGYAKVPDPEHVAIIVTSPDREEIITVPAIKAEEIRNFMI